MDGYVHAKIVRAAMFYMQNSAIAEDNRILSGLFLNGGDRFLHLPHEAYLVDSYDNIALSASTGLCETTDDLVIAGSMPISPLSHFCNRVFGHATVWEGGVGYAECNVRKSSDEDLNFADKCAWGAATVDLPHSSLLPLVRPWFCLTSLTWEQYWKWDYDSVGALQNEYPPANIVAGMYYRLLLEQSSDVQVSHVGNSINSDKDISVGGGIKFISGFTFLAPVLHLVADLCVPHHVVARLGSCHSDWEDNLQTACGTELYGLLNQNLVETLLVDLERQDHFLIGPEAVEGYKLEGCFAPELFLATVADFTLDRICKSLDKNKDEVDAMAQSDWANYCTPSADDPEKFADQRDRLVKDYEYAFNLAVAASVILLRRAHQDMVALGLIKDTQQIIPLPPLEPERGEATLPEKRRVLPFTKGFDWRSIGKIPTAFNSLMASAIDVFDAPNFDRASALSITDKLLDLLTQTFVGCYRRKGRGYAPYAIDFRAVFPHQHPFTDLATFRLASSRELHDIVACRAFLKEKMAYEFKANLAKRVYLLACAKMSQKLLADTGRPNDQLNIRIKRLETNIHRSIEQKQRRT